MLSIIIPYYNTLEETKELLKILIPQLNKETELIIIDDGCNEKKLDDIIDMILCSNIKINDITKIKVIHLIKNSGSASKPRNIGLENANGDYITFIDSDDMVSSNYINEIQKAIQNNTDIIFMSWKSKIHNIKMNYKPPKWNCSVWCRVYKKEIIGNIRFDENLKIAEDWLFNKQIQYNTSCCIRKTIYFYNNGRKGSLING